MRVDADKQYSSLRTRGEDNPANPSQSLSLEVPPGPDLPKPMMTWAMIEPVAAEMP